MTEDFIQDDWVTEDPAALEAFITQGREHYDALEQALEPLVVAVTDLKRDWKPRWQGYWKPKLTALLSLRTATQATYQMFDREQSSEEDPVPVIFYGSNIGYSIPLSLIEGRIEEVGILLTSYIEVCDSHEEQHLRQRQRVLVALKEVVETTRDAVQKGRTGLDLAPQEQQQLLAPRRRTRKAKKTTSPSTTDAPEQSPQERYTDVELALEPIAVAVTRLEGPGKPRRKQYRDLKAALLTLRAAHAAILVFDTSESETLLAPPGIVERRCEEAISAVKTAHEASDSDQEQSLQQRQSVLKAVQAVVEVTREAIRKGRATLDEAPQKQSTLYALHTEGGER